MNARFLSTVRVGLTATAITLCGALALSTSAGCAGDSVTTNSNGGTTSASGGQQSNGGNTGNPGGQGGTSTGGDTGSTTPGECAGDPGSSAVNFCSGKAQGAMTGYGFIALGIQDSVSSPVCAEDPKDLNNTRPITAPPIGECEAEGKTCPRTGQAVWNAADKLCISGKIPKVQNADYTSNWGLQIGVNTADPPAENGGQTLGEVTSDAASFTTVALTTEGSITASPSGTPTVRMVIHLKTQGCTWNPYCATMAASDKAAILANFNTQCWNGSKCATSAPSCFTCNGDADCLANKCCDQLKPEDIPNIDKIGVQICSDTSREYTAEDYCLKGITFTKD
jgi:hypothetical protein